MTNYEPGSEIAGYRIESLIGRGGMAVVYRAEDMRLGRKVALKLLSPQLADNEQFRLRFIRESRLAASLDHPNIVPIYEAGDADGQLFIAMRYVIGSDLMGLLAEQGGQLTLRWTTELFVQIGDALDSAHRAGLVHRDVKPGNILIASGEHPRHVRGEHVYLTDFGLTKRTSELTAGLTGTGHFLGTVDYVSPEQIQGKPVGSGTDIYALGCMLYQCLTGQPPFRRDDDAAMLWAHLVETPPPVTGIHPEIPAAVNGIVARAMAKEPAHRYPTCQELVTDLERALTGPTSEGSAAPRPAGATSDDTPPDLLTVTGEVAGGSQRPSAPVVPFPAPADASHAPSLIQDDASVGDQPEPVAPSGPFTVAAERSPVVAAAETPTAATRGPRPTGSRRGRNAVRLLLAGLFVLALGAGAMGANLLNSAQVTSVVAEPANSAAGHPFTLPPSPDGAAPASTPGPSAGGGSASGDGVRTGTTDTRSVAVAVAGNTPGLYGGTRAEACNAAFMTTFFAEHPDRAAAWATAQGIQISEIGPFLRSLTPVVLRTDTAVTNHGFFNGKANAFQSVLQAGTAVLVDEHGVPRVRCACGNPLYLPTARHHVRYTGQPWPELSHRPVVVVRPVPVIIQHFIIVVVQQNTTVVLDRVGGDRRGP